MDNLYNSVFTAQLFGNGDSTTVEPLSVTANGTYTADAGKAYSPVTVNVASPAGETVKFTVPAYSPHYGGEANILTYTNAQGVRTTVNYNEETPVDGVDVLKGTPVVWSITNLIGAGYSASISPSNTLNVMSSTGVFMIAMDTNVTLTIIP